MSDPLRSGPISGDTCICLDKHRNEPDNKAAPAPKSAVRELRKKDQILQKRIYESARALLRNREQCCPIKITPAAVCTKSCNFIDDKTRAGMENALSVLIETQQHERTIRTLELIKFYYQLFLAQRTGCVLPDTCECYKNPSQDDVDYRVLLENAWTKRQLQKLRAAIKAKCTAPGNQQILYERQKERCEFIYSDLYGICDQQDDIIKNFRRQIESIRCEFSGVCKQLCEIQSENLKLFKEIPELEKKMKNLKNCQLAYRLESGQTMLEYVREIHCVRQSVRDPCFEKTGRFTRRDLIERGAEIMVPCITSCCQIGTTVEKEVLRVVDKACTSTKNLCSR